MQNVTSTHRHDTEPIPYTLTDKAHDVLEGGHRDTLTGERAEARRMLDELHRLLQRGGRLNICALERAMRSEGHPVTRRQLHRWFAGTSTPWTTTPVERLARAAGVDRAYLMVGGVR